VTDEELSLALADAGDDHGACAAVWWSHAQCIFLGLQFPLSVRSAEEAVTHAEHVGDMSTVIAAMVHIGFVRNALSPQAGQKILYEADALPWAPVSVYDAAATRIAMNLTVSDNLDSARPTLEALAVRCRASGDEAGMAGIATHRVELEARAGDLGAARAWMRTRREVAAGDGEWQSPYVQDYLEALVLGREGDGEGAVDNGTRGLARATAIGDWAFSQSLAHTAAVGHLLCGRSQEALDLLTGIRELRELVGMGEPGVWRYEFPEIEALVNLGRLDVARLRVEELDEFGRRLDRPRMVGEAALGRGLVLGGTDEHGPAIEALTEAISIFDAARLPWERERARLALGVALRRGRARNQSRDALAEAARGFEQLAAPGWAAQARSEAARISGRSRSDGDLTPIEQQVADLVATGLPNKDVAAQLFISPKTVESHLSRIYAKTGVKSRTELAALRSGRLS
jgi:DNA-binding CsgD family transcriptional regulator